MSICPIPGFGPNALTPTRENLAALKNMLALPVTAFADAHDIYVQGGYKQTPPVDGPPKFWNDPGYLYGPVPNSFVFIKRNADGSYPSRTLTRDAQQFPIHMNILSASAISFLADERPFIQVPELEIRTFDFIEVGRLSFGAEVEDPIDYPIAWVDRAAGLGNWITSLNKSAILFVENGFPYICTIEEASRKWPVQWGPIATKPPVAAPGAVTDEQFVTTMRKAISSSTWRQQALIIINSPTRTDAAKRADLLKLG